jgi:hypothetical protein
MEPRGVPGLLTETFAVEGASRDVIAPARADTRTHSAATDARPGMAARSHDSTQPASVHHNGGSGLDLARPFADSTGPETRPHAFVRVRSATPIRTRPGATATVIDPDSAGIPETRIPPNQEPAWAHSDIEADAGRVRFEVPMVAGVRPYAHNDPRGKDRFCGGHTSPEEVVRHRASLSMGQRAGPSPEVR